MNVALEVHKRPGRECKRVRVGDWLVSGAAERREHGKRGLYTHKSSVWRGFSLPCRCCRQNSGRSSTRELASSPGRLEIAQFRGNFAYFEERERITLRIAAGGGKAGKSCTKPDWHTKRLLPFSSDGRWWPTQRTARPLHDNTSKPMHVCILQKYKFTACAREKRCHCRKITRKMCTQRKTGFVLSRLLYPCRGGTSPTTTLYCAEPEKTPVHGLRKPVLFVIPLSSKLQSSSTWTPRVNTAPVLDIVNRFSTIL